jgi:hypothetical protein
MFLFCLIVWKNWLRSVLLADSVETHLHMFQERLSSVGNGLQERGLEATGENMESICSNSQTCCNVVQSDLSNTGLGGHFGGESWVKMSVCYTMYPWEVHCYWLLLFISCTGQRCDAEYIFSDISPTPLKEANIGHTI